VDGQMKAKVAAMQPRLALPIANFGLCRVIQGELISHG